MKPPVLVIGWIPRIVVTIARSLHEYGISVDVADCVLAVPIRSSAIRRLIPLPYPNDQPAEFRRALLKLVEQTRYGLLIPADDVAMAAILEHYDEIKAFVRIGCPPPPVTQQVLSKDRTLEVARRCGIRMPRTAKAFNSGELSTVAQEIPFPWILKPAEKEKRFEEFTSRRFDSMEEVTREYPEHRKFDPPMLVQEFCEGVGVGVQALLHEGKCFAIFQHRRLKELPYTGGVAVTAIAEQPDPGLVKVALTLLENLKWEGVAMVEFRLNLKTGEAVLMEVNGRYWGTLSLPVAAGLNFPLYHWQLLHGETPSIPTGIVVGQRWRWTVGYLSRLYRLAVVARHSPEARRELKASLVQIPSDFSPRFCDATFQLADPLPSILEFLRGVHFYAIHMAQAGIRRVPVFGKYAPAGKMTRA